MKSNFNESSSKKKDVKTSMQNAQGFTIRSSGHPRHQKIPIPKSDESGIHKLIDDFKKRTGYPRFSELEYAQHFYSKTQYILDFTSSYLVCDIVSDIVSILICESILLFEREFSYFSGGRPFSYFIRTRQYFRTGKSHYRLTEKTIKHISKLNRFPNASRPILSALKTHAFQAIQKKLNMTQLQGMDLSHEGLTDLEFEYFRDRVWPRYCQENRKKQWIRKNREHYERCITNFHLHDYDQYELKMRLLNDGRSRLQSWLSKSINGVKASPEGLSFGNAEKKCKEWLSKFDNEDNNSDLVLKRVTKAYLDSDRNYIFDVYKVLCQGRGLYKRKSLVAQVEKTHLFLCVLYAFPDIFKNQKIIEETGREFWTDMCSHEHFPKLEYFRAIAKKCPRHLINLLYPLQFGILIDSLLNECLPHFPEALTHECPYMSNADTLGRYKLLFPEAYDELVCRISKKHQKINDYKKLWEQYDIQPSERVKYLKTAIVNVQMNIPTDRRLWIGYEGSLATTQRREKAEKDLRLLLLENAIQDCIRAEAKTKLYELYTEKMFDVYMHTQHCN